MRLHDLESELHLGRVANRAAVQVVVEGHTGRFGSPQMIAAPVPAAHEMVHRARIFNAQLPRRVGTLTLSARACQWQKTDPNYGLTPSRREEIAVQA